MLISQLALASIACASVELDFRIGNSHDLQLEGKTFKSQHVYKRDVSNSNNTVEPVINATLTTSYNFYYGDLLVGQPPQKFEVLLDTGSPISWLYGPRKSYNNATRFYSNESLTFKELNSSFSAEYGSGIYLGRWGADLVAAPQFVASNITHNVTLNGTATNGTNATHFNLTWDYGNSTDINSTALNKTILGTSGSSPKSNISLLPYSVPFEFGIVSSFAATAGAPGLLGLGPHIDGAGPKGYMSLPEAYKRYNVTSSPAFSVFLEKQAGKFIFGGADLKYVELPFYRYSPKSQKGVSPTSWTITLDSLAFNGKDNYSINSTAILDTGSPVSLLPPRFVEKIGKALKFHKDIDSQAYYTNSTEIPKGTLSFHLNGGLEVKANISDFLVPGEYIWLDNGPKNVTALSFLGSSSFLLGDAFFRNTYTILDPSSGDVLLAKRSKVTINSTNSTNASSVVPINKLLQRKSAIVDVAYPKKNSTRSGQYKSYDRPIAANEYIGTVAAEKAASVSSADATSTSSASKSSTSASGSGSSSSSKSKNNAVVNGITSSLVLIAAPILYLL